MVSLSRSRAPRTTSEPATATPRSHDAAQVVQLRLPDRPAQLIVHGDSLSVGDKGSWGFVAGTRHLPRRGHWLARNESRERSAPACPWAPRKQVSGVGFS